MNRRDFLRRSALITAGVVAADQIELLERLAPRRLWPSIAMNTPVPTTFTVPSAYGIDWEVAPVADDDHVIFATEIPLQRSAIYGNYEYSGKLVFIRGAR